MAAVAGRAPLLPADGRLRHLLGPGGTLGGVAGAPQGRPRRAPGLPARAGHRRAAGGHRHRGGVDGHRAGPPAMGDLRRAAHRGRGDADAGTTVADGGVRADLRVSGSGGDGAAVAADRAQPDAHGRVPGAMSLADALAGTLVVALNAYVLSGGADFGGGVWDLVASGPRKRAQRDLVAQAIGPVWEANHVWLILAVVLLFTCFPPAFARLAVALNLPLTGALVGIVLRGSAFAFRGYGGDRDVVQLRWGRVFAVASLVTPILLGAAVGAVASGAIGEGGRVKGEGFVATYVTTWLAPFPLAVGLFTLCCFAFLAAVYLTLETPEGVLREDFRRRALWAGVAVGVAAGLALIVARPGAPLMRGGLVGSDWALPFQLGTGMVAVGALGALWTRRYRLARVAAAAQVSLILWGWAGSQYPFVIPTDLAIADTAAPPATLRLVLIALAVGAAVLVPSLVYL